VMMSAWMSSASSQSTIINAGSYHCEGPPLTLLDLIIGRTTENMSSMELGARTVEVLSAAYRSIGSGALEGVTD